MAPWLPSFPLCQAEAHMEMAVMAEPMSRYTPSTGGSSFKQGPTGAVTRTCKGAEAMAPRRGHDFWIQWKEDWMSPIIFQVWVKRYMLTNHNYSEYQISSIRINILWIKSIYIYIYIPPIFEALNDWCHPALVGCDELLLVPSTVASWSFLYSFLGSVRRIDRSTQPISPCRLRDYNIHPMTHTHIHTHTQKTHFSWVLYVCNM